jgi:hypothetical protein
VFSGFHQSQPNDLFVEREKNGERAKKMAGMTLMQV